MTEIKPHSIKFDLSHSESFWYKENLFINQILNSFHLLFPATENFFVDTLKESSKKINNQNLINEIKGFIGQETKHANEHQKVWEVLKKDYKIDRLIESFSFFVKKIIQKNLSLEYSLSLTSALEHYTTMLAKLASNENFFDKADPEIKKIYIWHIKEELDHSEVAFKVLNEMNSDYFLRASGMCLATILFFSISGTTIFVLSVQDKKIFQMEFYKDMFEVFFGKKYNLFENGLNEIKKYFEIGFHPKRVQYQEI